MLIKLLLSLKDTYEKQFKDKCPIAISEEDAATAASASSSSSVFPARSPSPAKGGFKATSGYDESYDVKAHDESRKEAMKKKEEELLERDNDISNLLVRIAKRIEKLGSDTPITELQAINFSCLNFILAQIFRNNSMLDVNRRISVYDSALEVCFSVSRDPRLLGCLKPGTFDFGPAFANHADILKLFKAMLSQGELFSKGGDEDSLEDADLLELVKKMKALDAEMAKSIPSSITALSTTTELKSAEPEFSPESKESDAALSQWLTGKRFELVDLTDEPFRFEDEYNASAVKPSKARLNRLRREIASLSDSLPDGIYLRVNEDRYDKMKVIIIGPANTPYEHGVFIFDLYLPPEYPSKSPKMRLLTTGMGRFRFNPNLYKDGYVCLSLLGTWDGPGWDPETSTILQILISIQAMIFCDWPYCNEPGWGGNEGQPVAKKFNQLLQCATAWYAMHDFLVDEKAIPVYFRQVVWGHFTLNKAAVLRTLKAWLDHSRIDYPGTRAAFAGEDFVPGDFKTVYDKLLGLLESIPKVDTSQ
jgi:ubiquitin-protein ligase